MKKIIYINNIYSILLYIENNNIFVNSINNTRKIKRNLQFIFFINNNSLILKYNLFKKKLYNHSYFKKHNTILESKENNLFKGTLYGFKSKIKIIGRGWKIIKSINNTLMIKLGYSHPLFLSLNPFTKYKTKKKKKKYYIFRGVSFDNVNTLASKFNLMRIPDIYTRKGIFHHRSIL